MMEIKFRGKPLDSIFGEYVYGWLIETEPNNVDGKYRSYILEELVFIPVLSIPSEHFIAVDTDTVGQYIGKKDWKGREIYNSISK